MKAAQRAMLTGRCRSIGVGVGVVVGVVVGLVVGGCADPPQDPDIARRVIGPSGGLITSVDSVLTLAIPPGALEQEVELFIQRTNEPPDVFGQAYLVRPNPELRYDISVTYRQTLPDDTSGLAVGAVDAAAYEAGVGGWRPLPVLRVDRRAKLVSGLDDGLSIFYALLDDAEAPSTTTAMDSGEPTTEGPTGETTSGLPGETTGGPDDTTGSATTASSGEEGSSGEPAVSFASEVQPILMGNCSCHYDGEPAGLSYATDAYGSLVGVPSTQAPALDRVAPGAPDDSYLWHKLNDTHVAAGGSGNPMPAPSGGLAAGSLAILEAWILEGAAP